jgi:TIGR03009 family protein
MPTSQTATPFLARVGRVLTARPDDPDGADARLLARFRDHRDPDAFAGLVARHGPLVAAVCRRVAGDAHLADDAFQATFLVLARRAAAVRPPGAVRGWLYGVAVRTAHSARVRADRRLRRERPVAAVPDRSAPEHAAADPDTLRILDEEIGRLPDRLRAAVVLCELGGTPRRAAAVRLAVPEGTVSSRLATARRVLAGRLRARGVAAGVLGALFTRAAAAAAATPPRLDAAALLTPAVIAPQVSLLANEVTRGVLAGKVRAGVLVAVALAGGLVTAGAPAPVPAADPEPAPPPRRVEAKLPPPEPQAPAPKPKPAAAPPIDPAIAAHLAAWEKASAGTTNVRADFTLKKKGPAFEGERVFNGSVLFMSPRFFRMRMDDQDNPADYEAYICDGKSVYAYSGLNRTVIEFPLPKLAGPPALGGGLASRLLIRVTGMWDQPPLLFVNRVMARALQDRFEVRLFKEDRFYVYLEFLPRTAAEKAEFEKVRVALILPTAGPLYEPYAPAEVWVRKPNGDEETWRVIGVKRNLPGVEEKMFVYQPVPGFKVQRARP